LAEPAEENHFFTFRHARQRRIPFVFKDLDIIAPDFLGKVLRPAIFFKIFFACPYRFFLCNYGTISPLTPNFHPLYRGSFKTP
ncbi:MAG: hypothetical protein PHS50_11645, partial [Kiritimatiellae bacterium]|nr:hypothetical protein [Kiritimatiellia bacterium]